MKRALGVGMLTVTALTLAACGGDDDHLNEPTTCSLGPLLARARDGEAGRVEARAACLFDCPLEESWAAGATAELILVAKDEDGGALSIESSNADVLVVEEVAPEDTPLCGSRVEVRVTATAPGDARLVVRRDGATLDTVSFTVRQPTALTLEGGSSLATAPGPDPLCTELGLGSVFAATLLDASGAELGYASPEWTWDIDGARVDAFGGVLLHGPSSLGLHEVRVRWGELERALTVNVLPTGTTSQPGFVCTAEAT